MSRWIENKSKKPGNEIHKVFLFQEDDIRIHYQERLNTLLQISIVRDNVNRE